MPGVGTTPVICLVIMALLQYVTFCTGVCEECLVTHLPNFDNLRILDYNLWNRKCPNIGVCFKLCYSDSLCVSYHYNEDAQSCYGYSSSFAVPLNVNTVTRSGTKLYLTCKGLNHFGAPCSSSTDCYDDDNVCFSGYCQCKANYKYSTVTWGCFQYYFGCYEDRSDDRMLPSDHIRSTTMTIEMCVSYCRGKGHKFAGLQYGKDCFCGIAIKSGYIQYTDAGCNMPCTGDATQRCGTDWKNSIYATRQ